MWEVSRSWMLGQREMLDLTYVQPEPIRSITS
jgi:hypothetical protein